jgi:predicted nicotinamide N-methyase
MAGSVKTMIRAYGLRVLLSGHPEVRKLKRVNVSSFHGNKVWTSSWLLMDFFRRRGLPEGTRILDVGCGWGLAGIYCAKKHNAVVTGVDVDPEVFPYLRLHAQINKVKIATMKRAFGGLTGKHLKNFDILIGADICFWDKLVYSLKRLINRALQTGPQMVLIADPGRPTFDELAKYFAEKRGAEILGWTIQRPRRIQGRILKIGSLME